MPLRIGGVSWQSPDDGPLVSFNEGQTLVELVCPAGPPRGRPELGSLAGEYQLMEEVGRGGFGTVYRAVHPVIGKEVAIKVLDESSLDDLTLEQRFVTEARAVNRIRHPNIVDIFGFGELPNGQKFYVMELLTGETLAALRKRAGSLPPRVAIEILEPLADALDAAHDVGILHRDLKPANVFLHRAPDGSVVVKLLDFGVAKILGGGEQAHTKTGGAIGTPAYMAPEQWAGGTAAAAADVYSLGVIAYELLTGRRPFAPSEVRDRFNQQLYGAPDSACRINPQLPRSIDGLLARMLADRPADRPPSAREAVALLRRALVSASADAAERLAPDQETQPLAKVVTVAKARQRRGIWFALAALALFATAAIAAWRLTRAPQVQPVKLAAPARLAAPVMKRQVEVPPPPSIEAVPSARAEPLVAVLVKAAPADAKVFSGGVELGPANQPLMVPRGPSSIELQVLANGFAPQTYRLVPDRARTITFVGSRPVRKPARQSRPPPGSELEF